MYLLHWKLGVMGGFVQLKDFRLKRSSSSVVAAAFDGGCHISLIHLVNLIRGSIKSL